MVLESVLPICPCTAKFFSFTGEVTILFLVVWVLYFIIWKRLLRPGASMKKYGLKDKGTAWAIVTGASDGIGKVFAKELASRGFNILLISRTLSKINDVATEIETKYKVKTKGIAVDFSKKDESIWESISSAVSSLDKVGILVNNVGINYDFPAKFLDASPEFDREIIDVNINVLLSLTRLVLPHMVKNKSGAIINLSSLAGRVPSPMLAVYSGTKAFVDFYSNALSAEYKSQGIDVLSIAPSLVVSNMSKVRRPNLAAGIVAPEPVVKSAIAALGKETSWCPHPVHAVIEFVLRSLPSSWSLGFVYRTHVDVRKRALAKQEREAKAITKKVD